jgi:transaldolase
MTHQVAQRDRLARLSAAGVSIWLDDLGRQRLRDGSLGRLVTERHVVGVTTNPTIFARAITGSNAGSPPTVSLGNSHGDG